MTETKPVMEWLPTDKDGNRLPRIEVQFTRGGRCYSYAWDGEPINVGDKVIAPKPESWRGLHKGIGIVTRLGSGYEGPVRTINRRINERLGDG